MDTQISTVPPPGPMGFVVKAFAVVAALLALLAGAKALGVHIEQLKVPFIGTMTTTQLSRDVQQDRRELAELRESTANLQSEFQNLLRDLEDGGPISVSAASIDDEGLETTLEQGAVIPAVGAVSTVEGEGYIWLGRFDPTEGAWAVDTLAGDLPTPQSMMGAKFTLTENTNLRVNAPREVARGYIDGVGKHGYVPKGTEVTIVEGPWSYRRKSGLQYWARVETSFVPEDTETAPAE